MRRTFAVTVALTLAACAIFASPARAVGTLCGTVRDVLSTSGIGGAGVFVFETNGTYTGFHAATDESGAFCISGIPAGTYDLQIRRDDYRTTIVRNVVVLDDVTGVDVQLTPGLHQLLPPQPNPARAQVQFRFRTAAPGAVRLEVLDLQGRLIKGWKSDDARAGDRSVTWDFRNADGRLMPAGRYVVRLVAGGSVITRAFARVP